MTVESNAEKHEFQAEVRQVLDLMVHSLYSNKEIFLRELISNASDACDKLRFEAIRNDKLYGDDPELRIEVRLDKDAGTLSVYDNGIGMSREELIDNLGTIARSGTKRFLAGLSGDQAADAKLIGQFGVGFYSSFIVAESVSVTSRRADETEAHRWSSDGQGEFSVEPVEDAPRGSRVELKLKKDESEFLERYRVRSLISKYSDHIAFPIKMEKPPAGADDDDSEQQKDVVDVPEWEVVNQASALWTRPKQEITDEEYQGFYKHVSHDFNEPLVWAHNRVEGNQSYTTLLYLPEKAAFDILRSYEDRRGLRLYVKRVFIMDAAEQLLPPYLRFVRGVVDSDDLPLNVSREILQENRLVAKIRASVIKRVLDMLAKLTEQPERYAKFWSEFGVVLKEGPVEDYANREKLLKLLRFASTHADKPEQTVSLEEYVARMKSGQDKIYYITADNFQAAKNSPHLEVFRQKGIEVLLMYDRVDEWMAGHLQEFDGKPFQSVAKGDIDLAEFGDESEKDRRKQQEKEAGKLIERLKGALGDRVDEVRVSHRLTDSPSCLVLREHDMAVHMQNLLKQAGHFMGAGKPSLEINPGHPLVQRADQESDQARFGEWALLLYEQAWLAEGGTLDDPAAFVKRMNGLLVGTAADSPKKARPKAKPAAKKSATRKAKAAKPEAKSEGEGGDAGE